MSTEDNYGNYLPEGDENQEHFDYAEDDTNNADFSTPGGVDSNPMPVKKNEDDKRLFVGGIASGITQEDLQSHFSQYGGIEQVDVKTDSATGRSRGFAFIRFADKQSVESVLASGPHVINGTQVEPKRVKARLLGNNKIFVGGLDPDFPEAELRAYFEPFGKVESIELPFDRVSNQRRKFSFVSFESEEVVEQICKKQRHRIGGQECDVKKAIRKQLGAVGSSLRKGSRTGFDFGRRGNVSTYRQGRPFNFSGERGGSGYGQSRPSNFSGERGGSGYGQSRPFNFSGERGGSGYGQSRPSNFSGERGGSGYGQSRSSNFSDGHDSGYGQSRSSSFNGGRGSSYDQGRMNGGQRGSASYGNSYRTGPQGRSSYGSSNGGYEQGHYGGYGQSY